MGCRCLAEGKRAQGHSEGCRTRLEAEIAKLEDGRARLTTAYLRSLPRDEGREPDADAEAPAAVPVPPRADEVQDQPMHAEETSRKRCAEDAGHEADDAGRGGAQVKKASDCGVNGQMSVISVFVAWPTSANQILHGFSWL